MAHSIKQGLEYFSVDTEWDRKMKLFQAKFKAEGVGVIVILWQWIYKEGYFIIWDDETKLMFASENHIEEEKLDEMIKFSIEKGIFDKTIYDKYKVLTSRGIQKRYLHSSLKRSEVHFHKNFLLIKPEIPNWSNTKIIINKDGLFSESKTGHKESETSEKESEKPKKDSKSAYSKESKESKFIDGLKAVEATYFSIFEEEFKNEPDYKHPRDRKIINDYLKKYPTVTLRTHHHLDYPQNRRMERILHSLPAERLQQTFGCLINDTLCGTEKDQK